MAIELSSKQVYLLQHSYTNNGCEETKVIGIFSTKEKAMAVVEEYQKIDGFLEYPDCFYIDVYELDRRFWEEGFITSDE